jgi:uncharacterized protein YbjT (DUF2867 family)
MRALVDRLPIMVTPRWVRIPTQPIAIDDVVAYLMAAIDLDLTESRVYEIGGSEVTTYGGLMKEYARQRDFHRILLPVPLLTPWLSSLWLRLVTPAHRRVGRALILGLKNPTTVRDPAALRDFSIRPLSTSQAITRALHQDAQGSPIPI